MQPSTNAFTDKATSLFIAAVSADCSASSLSTAPSAHLVRVGLRLGLRLGLLALAPTLGLSPSPNR